MIMNLQIDLKYVFILLLLVIFGCQDKPSEQAFGFDTLTDKALNYLSKSKELNSWMRKPLWNKTIDFEVRNNEFRANYEDFYTVLVKDEKRKDNLSRKDWFKLFSKCQQPIKETNKLVENDKNKELVVFTTTPLCDNFVYLMVGKNTKKNVHDIDGKIYYFGEAMKFLFEFNSSDKIENVYTLKVVY